MARLVAGEQVLAVVGVEEFAQRLDPADDQHEIVLAFKREHGIDKIVPRALLAQLHFQAVGEEGRAGQSASAPSSVDLKNRFESPERQRIRFGL